MRYPRGFQAAELASLVAPWDRPCETCRGRRRVVEGADEYGPTWGPCPDCAGREHCDCADDEECDVCAGRPPRADDGEKREPEDDLPW